MQQLVGEEQAVPVCFSYQCENKHGQKPNKHKQLHHGHETQHYVDPFEYHNAKPVSRTELYFIGASEVFSLWQMRQVY